MKCYLDLDGVLADWVKAAAAVHGFNLEELISRWTPGHYDMKPATNMTSFDFYKPMKDERFWVNIPKMPEFALIVGEAVRIFGDVFILSKPLYHGPGILDAIIPSTAGKLTWIKQNLKGFYPDRIIITAAKEECAGPDKVLFDDCDQHIMRWQAAGGLGYLVPRHWNSAFNMNTEVVLKNAFDYLECYRKVRNK